MHTNILYKVAFFKQLFSLIAPKHSHY